MNMNNMKGLEKKWDERERNEMNMKGRERT